MKLTVNTHRRAIPHRAVGTRVLAALMEKVPKNLTEALIADAMDTLNGLNLDRAICDSRVASLHQTVPKRCLETGVFKDV